MARNFTVRATGEFNTRSFVIAVLRRASYRTPMRQAALSAARRTRGVYNCATCSGKFSRTEIQVDHAVPCIAVTGWDGWEAFIQRLFCPATGLSVMCKPCHQIKTNAENAIRRTYGAKKRIKTGTKKMAKRKARASRAARGGVGKVRK